MQALVVEPLVKIAIDVPGHGNLAMVMVMLLAGGLINLVQIQLVLGRVLRRLRSQSLTDELTGSVNRRGLLLRMENLHQWAQRVADTGRGYAVLMVDVDHFKAVNDRLGHAEGDRVLRRVPGIKALALAHSEAAEAVTRQADVALYTAKTADRNWVVTAQLWAPCTRCRPAMNPGAREPGDNDRLTCTRT